jgi:hypothetical protein
MFVFHLLNSFREWMNTLLMDWILYLSHGWVNFYSVFLFCASIFLKRYSTRKYQVLLKSMAEFKIKIRFQPCSQICPT